jgi:hypothetical protein
VPPLLLTLLGLAHPLVFPQIPLYRQIQPIAGWWFTLHLIQLPLIGLLALGIVLLTRDLRGVAASVSRIAAGFFAVFYVAMIAILGVSLPLLVGYGAGLPEAQQAVVAQGVQTVWDNRLVGNFSLVAMLGKIGWVVAVLAAAIALRETATPKSALALVVTGALFFGFSHTRPFGPIGMALFLAGVTWMHYRKRMIWRR